MPLLLGSLISEEFTHSALSPVPAFKHTIKLLLSSSYVDSWAITLINLPTWAVDFLMDLYTFENILTVLDWYNW